jgi:hypothetical protein
MTLYGNTDVKPSSNSGFTCGTLPSLMEMLGGSHHDERNDQFTESAPHLLVKLVGGISNVNYLPGSLVDILETKLHKENIDITRLVRKYVYWLLTDDQHGLIYNMPMLACDYKSVRNYALFVLARNKNKIFDGGVIQSSEWLSFDARSICEKAGLQAIQNSVELLLNCSFEVGKASDDLYSFQLRSQRGITPQQVELKLEQYRNVKVECLIALLKAELQM